MTARKIFLIALALAPGFAGSAYAQSDTRYLKERCSQLLGYYAYYGIDRRENSDGVKNGVWVAASVDCGKGRYQEGIAEMEQLLRDKNMPVVAADKMSTPDYSVAPMSHAVANAP
ncbi:MAG: hypothetical protein JOY81_14275 [Alphaproteobacteria bacterium]|nr:hypothetical protein [Alphaproteobacteria bacterium]